MIQFAHFKCMIQLILINIYSCIIATTINLLKFSIIRQNSPYALLQSIPSPHSWLLKINELLSLCVIPKI